MEENKKVFQFAKKMDYPIYVELNPNVIGVESFLLENNFSLLLGDELKKYENSSKSDIKSRILQIEKATPTVTRQIAISTESDRFGAESISPRSDYKVYRYKNLALMVYSLPVCRWQLGVTDHFASTTTDPDSRVVINRFVSWALSRVGVVGFWGVPVDEGFVVMPYRESLGEAVFVDWNRQKLLTIEGEKELSSSMIMRLDHSLVGRSIGMKCEELFSFLSMHCTYFDYSGHTPQVRQVLQTMSKTMVGVIHPKDNYKPRTDLSL